MDPDEKDRIKAYIKRSPLWDASYHLPSLIKNPRMAPLIWEIRQAFNKGVEPGLYGEGINESYLLRDRYCKPLAIFKPSALDQAKREWAAHLIDGGFAGVPDTVMTGLYHPAFGMNRWGALQLYCEGRPLLAEREKIEGICPRSVRKIALLDMRLLNGDRHEGNVLVEGNHLIPIDHQDILPDSPAPLYFSWYTYTQAKSAFVQEEKEWVYNWSLAEEMVQLFDAGITKEATSLFAIASLLLQESMRRNYCAQAMAALFLKRQRLPSFFEILVDRVKQHDRLPRSLFFEAVRLKVWRILDDAACKHKEWPSIT